MYLLWTLVTSMVICAVHPHSFATHFRPLPVEYRYGQCDLQEANGSGISGVVRLRQIVSGQTYKDPFFSALEVDVSVTGLDSTDDVTKHGFHVHEFGDTGDDCADAGGHFNPLGTDHGSPSNGPGSRHAGDWGNLPEDDLNPSTIRYKFTDYLASLSGKYSIYGRAIVLHANADDLGKGGNAESLATGNAGSRVACCIIRVVQGWD